MAFKDIYEKDFYVLAYDEGKRYYLEYDESDRQVVICYLFVDSKDATEYAAWINEITKQGGKISVFKGNNLEGTVINIYDATCRLENKFLRVVEANGIATEDGRKIPKCKPIIFTNKEKSN